LLRKAKMRAVFMADMIQQVAAAASNPTLGDLNLPGAFEGSPNRAAA
jgi:hypothetical protein